jgi:hypothetical protein
MPRHRFMPSDPAYPVMGQELFGFLNRHAPNRYSARSLMAVVRQVDAQEAPLLVFDADPAEVDRLTEIKSGGLNAAAIVLRDGRVLLATHTEKRRSGFGAAVLSEVLRHRGDLADQDIQLQFWTGADNVDGQRFLIARGLQIIATRANGQLCYAPGDMTAW